MSAMRTWTSAAFPVRLASRRPCAKRSTVCLARGVRVISEEKINDNRVKIRVAITSEKAEIAVEDGLEELGKSVQFPKFERRRKNAPLPPDMVMAALGRDKVSTYAAGKLSVETICDHAKDSGRLVRQDLTPEMGMAPEELAKVGAQLIDGSSLEFDVEYDFVDKDYRPPDGAGN